MSVRKDVPPIRGRKRADLDQLADAAAPIGVGLEHVERIDLQQLEKAPARIFVLAGGDRHSGGAFDRGEVVDTIRGTGSSTQRGRYSSMRWHRRVMYVASPPMKQSNMISMCGPTASRTVLTSSTF